MSNWNRREFLAAGAAAAAPKSQPPNVIVLFADDQRFNTIHALGNADIRTPNLDRMVANGVAFDRACIMGGTSGAVCIASRAMLLTGKTLFRAVNSVENGQGQSTLLGEHFRNNGYKTYGVGKWHNPPKLFNRCFENGASIFFGGMDNHAHTSIQDYDATGEYPKSRARLGTQFSSEMFADAAIDFLKEQDRSKPFFLYTAFTAPHDPRMAPPGYQEMYSPSLVKLPENYLPQHPFDNGELQVRDELLAAFPRGQNEVCRHIAEYYSMITHLDLQIGRIMETLKKTNLDRNTIVVFAGDNGLALGGHGLMGKQNLYDDSVRVPLIMTGPGLSKRLRRPQFGYLLDLFPTLCALTGLPVPDGVEGQNLLGGGRQDVFFAYRHFQRAVRTDEWKLILYNVKGKVTRQLFQMQDDPFETRNLADVPEAKTKIAELTGLLKQWMQKVGDPLDLDKPNWGFNG